jgi:enoyl-CoA hydratase/carnithine racemase
MAVERAKIDVEERDEGVAITLLSGDTGNYLGLEELAQLTEVLDRAEADGKRWVLVRQQGKDFCLGRAPGGGGEDTRKALLGFVQRWQSLELMTVAAADGGCAGFGVGVFALADISVASEGTWFQFPEILHGPFPAIVASWLFDRVPYKQALYWTVTGAKFTAADAYQFGLASVVVPAAGLAGRADEIVTGLEAVAAKSLRDGKTAAQAMSAAPRDLGVRRSMALKWFLSE